MMLETSSDPKKWQDFEELYLLAALKTQEVVGMRKEGVESQAEEQEPE